MRDKLEHPTIAVPPTIAVGAFTVAMLTDGLWLNDGGCMFGVVPRELWQREHPPDDRNRIRLNLTCPLIIRGNDAILVDTGIGNRLDDGERRAFGHDDGWLADHIRSLGMELGDITHVIVSHLHFDHAGGLIRRRKSGTVEPAFPRARVLIQKGELDVARNSTNERLRAAYRHCAEVLGAIDANVDALDGETSIVPGLTAIPTGGHTRDHQVVVVRDGGACFAHLADIVPTRSHMRGAWNQSYDLDALRTMDEKARYLTRAAGERWWVSFAHDAGVFAARVNVEGKRFVVGERVDVLEELRG
jgi:glyoxylase-like metal-dependent hydrolase (beta-lactamase superfamily II)